MRSNQVEERDIEGQSKKAARHIDRSSASARWCRSPLDPTRAVCCDVGSTFSVKYDLHSDQPRQSMAQVIGHCAARYCGRCMHAGCQVHRALCLFSEKSVHYGIANIPLGICSRERRSEVQSSSQKRKEALRSLTLRSADWLTAGIAFFSQAYPVQPEHISADHAARSSDLHCTVCRLSARVETSTSEHYMPALPSWAMIEHSEQHHPCRDRQTTQHRRSQRQ